MIIHVAAVVCVLALLAAVPDAESAGSQYGDISTTQDVYFTDSTGAAHVAVYGMVTDSAVRSVQITVYGESGMYTSDLPVDHAGGFSGVVAIPDAVSGTYLVDARTDVRIGQTDVRISAPPGGVPVFEAPNTDNDAVQRQVIPAPEPASEPRTAGLATDRTRYAAGDVMVLSVMTGGSPVLLEIRHADTSQVVRTIRLAANSEYSYDVPVPAGWQPGSYVISSTDAGHGAVRFELGSVQTTVQTPEPAPDVRANMPYDMDTPPMGITDSPLYVWIFPLIVFGIPVGVIVLVILGAIRLRRRRAQSKSRVLMASKSRYPPEVTIIPDTNVLLNAIGHNQYRYSTEAIRFLGDHRERLWIPRDVERECYGILVTARAEAEPDRTEEFKREWQTGTWSAFRDRVEDITMDKDTYDTIRSAHRAAMYEPDRSDGNWTWMQRKIYNASQSSEEFAALPDNEKRKKIFDDAETDRILVAKAAAYARTLPPGRRAVLISGDSDITYFAAQLASVLTIHTQEAAYGLD